MKISDLNAEALEIACQRTYEYEGVGVSWDRAKESEKKTYRKEIGATIAAYLGAIQTITAPTAELDSSPIPTNQGDSASVPATA